MKLYYNFITTVKCCTHSARPGTRHVTAYSRGMSWPWFSELMNSDIILRNSEVTPPTFMSYCPKEIPVYYNINHAVGVWLRNVYRPFEYQPTRLHVCTVPVEGSISVLKFCISCKKWPKKNSPHKHTVSDQILELGTAWERGYHLHMHCHVFNSVEN